jgi:hypothetical protein
LFETYVYAQILSSVDLWPFVIDSSICRTRSSAPPMLKQRCRVEKIS